jgi:chaperonin GroES
MLENQTPETMDEVQSVDTNPDVLLLTKNYAEDLSDDKLLEIGEVCKRGFEADLESRSDWENDLEDWTNLAKQLRETKNYPWSNASNVKYPLISTAAMQFAARAYPSLVPSGGHVVKATVIGKDLTGDKWDKADRVSTFMSYQILHDMDGWEEDMDKMLMMLPIVGCMFKKTWYDRSMDKIHSKLIMPKNFVVNYWTRSLKDTERTSEIIELSQRKMKEMQNKGIYRDITLDKPTPYTTDDPNSVADDETLPYILVEQHTFLDLDDDDYREPYIVTFIRHTGQVLSIYRRHTLDDMELDEKKKIVSIKPTQMYTKFGFVPNPDGSFYDIAFGVLLGPLNESVNTLINQLIDAGTLNNLNGGFIGKALKIRSGDQRFTPGEWKPVNATGDDLRKQIVPLPSKEPSNVLFQLMGTLITSGKELASVAEIFTGKMPGQNTPATTTMATVEQGMKVFTAVYKRLFRALGEEFKKIFDLNKTYLDPHTYSAVLDTEIGPDDFDSETYDICPGADPTATSGTEKLMKAQGLLELLPMMPGLLDPIEVVSRVLEAQEQPNWQKLFSQQVQQSGQLPPPPPDPKLMAIQAKVEADQQKSAMDMQQKQMDMELEGRDRAMQMQMKQQEHAQKMQHEAESAQVKAASDIAMANIFASTERAKAQQNIVNAQDQHTVKMQQMKESSLAKSHDQKSKSGNSTQSRKPSSKK